MGSGRFDRISLGIVLSALISMLLGAGSHAMADNHHCVPVGGSFMTNLAAIPGSVGENPGQVPSTTLGRVTGDLSGAVAATILKVEPSGENLVFTVQHHLVTDSGDFVFADEAHATVIRVPGAVTPLFAIVTYPVHITGG